MRGRIKLPLKLDLKAGEKIVINGAVLENVGPNSRILVHNQAMILREKEVLTEDICATPASRVYLALQFAYMFPDKKAEYLELSETYLSDFITACPSASEIAVSIRKHIEDQNLYKGLKDIQKLIEHEAQILQAFNQDIERIEASDQNDS